MFKNHIIIVVGVSGVGKTTIGKMLAKHLTLPFIDADDFHPISNIEKMKSGNPLNDDDRFPWLNNLNNQLKKATNEKGIVLGCSALKENYRVLLSNNITQKIHWVILKGDQKMIQERMMKRSHYFSHEMLQSQFDTWEEPDYGFKINIGKSPEDIVKEIIEKNFMEKKSEIGLIGLGVMGKSLSRNIARNNIVISVYNRHVDGVEENVAKDFVNQYEELKAVPAFDEIEAFVNSLNSPKTIFLMVNAGKAVDAVIHDLKPHLSVGDIIIDGGNSHYKDTERRVQELSNDNILYIGTGVSGGEEGALKGPSIMPGGSKIAFDSFGGILKKIAAKDATGATCCAYIGRGGAGHFVKMVHNGIEYGEMQLIAEVYGVLRYSLGKSNDEISKIFHQWAATYSASYLLEITADILTKKEKETHLVDLILDKSGNKGTGSWTTIAACELGVAIPTLTAALFARYQSAQYDTRQNAAKKYQNQDFLLEINIEELRTAYQLARVINHHQGYDLIAAASKQYDWGINFKDLSRIWTNGCIIRSKLMVQISETINDEGNILMDDSFHPMIANNRLTLNKIVSAISATNISAPCMSSTLSYLNGFTEKKSLANIIQAQRDYFGAHTYERIDSPRGEKFHTNWTL